MIVLAKDIETWRNYERAHTLWCVFDYRSHCNTQNTDESNSAWRIFLLLF